MFIFRLTAVLRPLFYIYILYISILILLLDIHPIQDEITEMGCYSESGLLSVPKCQNIFGAKTIEFIYQTSYLILYITGGALSAFGSIFKWPIGILILFIYIPLAYPILALWTKYVGVNSQR